ncbi:hypothetical protein K0M31_016674 [Melipona bicolor]|uniref:Uncharacterized protein n=1 Tax=Melipona bicolor TaxID=60889 RepID=A0AA40FEF4_9HYME|nr:hypothetical protein K0M31_016674 [Melipona bicolor]
MRKPWLTMETDENEKRDGTRAKGCLSKLAFEIGVAVGPSLDSCRYTSHELFTVVRFKQREEHGSDLWAQLTEGNVLNVAVCATIITAWARSVPARWATRNACSLKVRALNRELALVN